jgi:DNA-binding PadR family transcriptional regulator
MRFDFHQPHHGHAVAHGHGYHPHKHGAGYHGHGGRGRGGWGEHDAERDGRRRRVFDAGELRLVLLKLIADQSRHGYELIRAIEELTGGAYVPSPGVVYPTLTMLQEMGQIEEAAAEGARKAFAITADGRELLATRKADVEALFARLAQLAAARERTDGGPIRRAMQNLRTVLMYRFDRDDVKPGTLHEAAAILDDAARKIEQL